VANRGFRIPQRNLAGWASELIAACYVSLKNRQQLGARYRNLYLTGDSDGEPQTFKKVRSYIQNRASMLYSPVELRFAVEPYGSAGPRDRAFGKTASTELLRQIRNNNVDTTIQDAVEWGMVKGKTFVQLLPTKRGIEPYMIQPETMGVEREDINSLDKQGAFVHSAWITPSRFAELVDRHPRKSQLMKNVAQYIRPANDEDSPGERNTERRVVIGGQLYPFKPQGTAGAGQGKNLANWLCAPSPTLDAKIMTNLIRLDELWVWDWPNEDWATIQIVGNDCIINDNRREPHNIIAYPDAQVRKAIDELEAITGHSIQRSNPLVGQHPFVEVCPNPLPDYFWGYSELNDVGALQEAINARWDGINRILRHQEDPSWFVSGAQSPAQQIRAKLRRPGGWFAEASPGAKVEKIAPELPPGSWESLHEMEQRFDTMGGQPPVMQGRGESGVRAQAHAETLVRLAGARLRDQALEIERQVEEVAGLGFDLLRAHSPDVLIAWIKEADAGLFKKHAVDKDLFEAPAPGMIGIQFLLGQLDERYKVSVDGHSASPAFSHEARSLAFDLNARGAIGKEALIEQTHPPHADALIADEERREAEQAAFIAQHPELLQKGGQRKH
jgi:hypothetical protein